MRKQADALKVCPIPDACLLVMAQRPYWLLGLPETRSLFFLIKNSPDQVEGYLDYVQPEHKIWVMDVEAWPSAEVRPSILHFWICARSLMRLKLSPQSVFGRKMRSVGYEGGR
jgi:hypothetical protein